MVSLPSSLAGFLKFHPYMRLLLFRKLFCDLCIASFPGPVDVWFSLGNTTYQNNSIVTLEDIGEGDDALLCMTNYCCQTTQTQSSSENWFFPNGTRVPGSGNNWDFYRIRDQMVVRLNRRGGGVEGIYRCDAMNVTQSIYIGVYSASTGEWCMLFWSYCNACVAEK